MRFAAVIFDFDGTVVENEDTYTDAFIAVLKKHGVPYEVTEDRRPQIFGIGLEENWTTLHERFSLPKEVTVTQLVHETQDEYHKRLSDVRVRSGLQELINDLYEVGVVVALATSNNWWIIEDELEDLGVSRLFNTTVTGEEVANKKPEPDIFLKAAEKLFVEPEECVVIEDSKAGILAARAAGMKVIAIRNPYTPEEDAEKADLIVDGFEEINTKLLDSLFLD
jgi:HAD superfamily hydrolase (TIGR01509 family)